MGRVAAAVGLTLATALLTGCGADSEESYCAALRSHSSDIGEMVGDAGPDALLGHLPMLKDLAAHAPDDLTDEWQTFINATEGLQEALDKAGVKPEEFDGGSMPASLTPAQKAGITDAADRLSAAETADAVAGIDQQARDVCKLNLGL